MIKLNPILDSLQKKTEVQHQILFSNMMLEEVNESMNAYKEEDLYFSSTINSFDSRSKS